MSIKQTEEQRRKNIKFKGIACTHWVEAWVQCQNGKRRVTRFGIFCVAYTNAPRRTIQTTVCQIVLLCFLLHCDITYLVRPMFIVKNLCTKWKKPHVNRASNFREYPNRESTLFSINISKIFMRSKLAKFS